MAFVPIKLLELSAAPAAVAVAGAQPARETRQNARRGAMEISLPNGANVSLDAGVEAGALRRVLGGARSRVAGFSKVLTEA